MMRKVFIIGSYFSDDPNKIIKNIKNANKIGIELLSNGYLPFVPQPMFAYWEEKVEKDLIMKACFEWIKNCDAVIGVAKGQAQKAKEYAESIGKYVAYSIKELDTYFKETKND